MVDKHEQIIRVWGKENHHFTVKGVQSYLMTWCVNPYC